MVKIVRSPEKALSQWSASTRLSPIFGVREFDTSTPREESFSGTNYLIFAGPLHPEDIWSCKLRPEKMWLSLGLLNVIILVKDAKAKAKVLQWLNDKKGISTECWHIRDGEIKSVVRPAHNLSSNEWRRSLPKASRVKESVDLDDTLREYSFQMATSMSRSYLLHEDMIDDLKKLNQLVKERVDQDKSYQVLGDLLNINAGLSRFSSQTYTGIPSITDNECRLRYHSLLGVGTATIALWRLRRFLEETLGKAKIPERFAALSKRSVDIELHSLKGNDPFWEKTDFLGEANIESEKSETVFPLLSYFSARDGFKSTTTTISVPLTALTSCCSTKWSLMTLTHEISHIIIDAVISEIYPDFKSKEELDKFAQLLNISKGENLLEEIKRYFLFGVSALEGNEDVPLTADTLPALLTRLKPEIDEAMTHIFDFMYFYGGDLGKYVRGIWTTWGTVPSIRDRIEEYVVRTICVATAKNLDEGKPEESAIKQVVKILKRLEKEGGHSTFTQEHIKEAIRLIMNNRVKLSNRVIEMRHFIAIARHFLFSPTLATVVREDLSKKSNRSGRKDKGGYNLKPKMIGRLQINNPWQFIEEYTTSPQVFVANSIWMYYILAFCFHVPDKK